MLDLSEVARLIREARLKSATGCHDEALGCVAQVLAPLREEVAKEGESISEARQLLFSALYTAGLSLYAKANWQAAMDCFQESLQLAHDANDMRASGAALHEIAQIMAHLHNFEQAAVIGRGAIRANILAGCETPVAMQGLAIYAILMKDLDVAEAMLEQVRECCEANGDLIGLGKAFHEMGLAAAEHNHVGATVSYLVKALRVKHISGDRTGFRTSRQALQEFVRCNPDAAHHPLLTNPLEAM